MVLGDNHEVHVAQLFRGEGVHVFQDGTNGRNSRWVCDQRLRIVRTVPQSPAWPDAYLIAGASLKGPGEPRSDVLIVRILDAMSRHVESYQPTLGIE